MNYTVRKAPFIRNKQDTKSIMLKLMIGLLVVLAFGLYNASRYGTQFLTNGLILLAVAIAVSVAIEVIFALIFKKNIKKHLASSFPLITPLILVLTVPVNTKPYVVAIATAVAVAACKMLFGGFGKNILNPAALGRILVLLLFAGVYSFDGIAQPTITTRLSILNWVTDSSTLLRVLNAYGGLDSVLVGTYFGAMGETCTVIILAVGAVLAIMNVIDWVIPATYLGTMFVGASIVALVKGISFAYPLAVVAAGGVAFAGVFMLTDPVTAPTSRTGKIMYAAAASIITQFCRFFTGYPEGAVISIIIVNVLALLIDRLFINKQLKVEKRNIILIILSLVLAIGFTAFAGISKENGAIIDRNNKEEGSPSAAVEMFPFSGEYPENKAQVTVDGNIYHVSAVGYHGTNEFDIEIEGGKVKSVKVVAFNDTQGVGDMCINDEGYLNDFVGKDINSEIDAYSGATMTSKSLIAAVAAALQAAK